MKRILLAAACLAGALTLSAQTRGGLSPEILAEISKGYTGTPAEKALRNALNGTPVATLALSGEALPVDPHFTYEVKTKGRTNQKSSGRCWLFTGLNVLRARMISKHDLGAFTFSQNYLFLTWVCLDRCRKRTTSPSRKSCSTRQPRSTPPSLMAGMQMAASDR